jgi:hypothetical protein
MQLHQKDVRILFFISKLQEMIKRIKKRAVEVKKSVVMYGFLIICAYILYTVVFKRFTVSSISYL